MALRVLTLLVLLVGCACAALLNNADKSKSAPAASEAIEQDTDLKSAASTWYSDRYNNFGVTGYGTIDDKNYYSGGSYDNSYGYNGYDNGYSGNAGYGHRGGSRGYAGYGGITGYGGYKSYNHGGNGGYGGYSGNGGLSSYYGYNNPSYQGANHLGYGYYKRPGYGNIYNNGITPNLVTGYRGYSK